MEIKNVTVLGAGIMGAGIAQICAQSGFLVKLRDINEPLVEKGMGVIKKNLTRLVSKGKIEQDVADKWLGAVTPVVAMQEAAKDADLVIEAILERMDIKKQVFADLDELAPKEAILATNTSGLSITEIGTATKRADKVLGIHFFNPVPVMKLVEIIKGYETSDETISAAKYFVENIKKVGIEVNEAPGFCVNRILIPMINEAIYVLAEGIASAEDIDQSMKLGANHPIGPLALADMVGLDTLLLVMDSFSDEFKDSKYRACPLLRKMVRAGHLGRKTGKGFYIY